MSKVCDMGMCNGEYVFIQASMYLSYEYFYSFLEGEALEKAKEAYTYLTVVSTN